jgi:hypothetical protein
MISSDRRDLFIALAPTDNRSSFEQELLEFVTYRDSGPVVSDLKWGRIFDTQLYQILLEA